MKHPKDISINDFTYDLPIDRIALYPLAQRDDSKLLIYKDEVIKENTFKNMDSFIEKDTILVFNTTKVIRARLNFFNERKQAIEIFCLEPDAQTLELTQAMMAQKTTRWKCLVGNLKRWKEGDLKLTNNQITLSAKLVERNDQYILVEFYWQPEDLHFSEILEIMGHTPIPPYLNRKSEAIDEDRYQTVYANQEGSVASPTAGLHFTENVLEKLKEKNIRRLSVTLHVGAGTFKPVKSASMLEHDMHSEWLSVDKETITDLMRNIYKPIIAVGTTSLRTLESLYWMGLKAFLNKNASIQELEVRQWDPYNIDKKDVRVETCLNALLLWMEKYEMERLVCHTSVLIAPPYELKIAKGIITNFHQPQSTLLLLISAIVGDKWRDIYMYAMKNGFRFLSYGDSSLLLK